MTILSLPVDSFKKLAKDLCAKVRSADPDACTRVRAVYNDASGKTDSDIASTFALMRAQHIVAVEHGFNSWDALLAASPIEARLAITMQRIPELNAFGIGLFHEDYKKSKAEQQAIYEANRARLRQSVASVEIAIDWLHKNVTLTKTINSRRSSYGLKHIVEQDTGYLTNGTFIAAGIIAGYPFKIERGSPNVVFGMSERSLKEVSARQNNPPPPSAQNTAKIHAEWDAIEAKYTESLLKVHVPLYFASSETQRAAYVEEIERAEREQVSVFGDNVPGGEWRLKWPAPAREAVLALWRTPRANPHA